MRTRDFVLTATLPVGAATGAADIASSVAQLKESVDAVHVGDDRAAHGAPDVLAVAALLHGQGVDPVVHLSCRDRNRLALQGGLRGLAALGITSVVVSRGQKIPEELRGRVKGVFDTTTLQFIDMAQRFSDADAHPASAGFYIGTRVSVTRPGKKWRAADLQNRIAAGAQFTVTQPCLNSDMLAEWAGAMVRFKLTHSLSVVVEIPILSSPVQAQKLKALYPGARIPGATVQAIAGDADPAGRGQALASEALRRAAATPGISGANLVFEGDPGCVAAVIAAAGLRG